MLDVADDQPVDDLRRDDLGRDESALAVEVLEQLDAREDVRRLDRAKTCMSVSITPGRTVIARKVGDCCSAAKDVVNISMPALATQ